MCIFRHMHNLVFKYSSVLKEGFNRMIEIGAQGQRMCPALLLSC